MRLLLVLTFLWVQDPSFDQVKAKIALHESSHGKYKVHFNVNKTADCGLYQINSSHFISLDSTEVTLAFDKIFKKYKVGKRLHSRVVAAIVDDKLNEELARKLYEMRGLKSWTSSRKFIK